MQLITSFYNHDGLVTDLDDEDGYGAVIDGNTLRVYDSEGKVLATGYMEMIHNRIVWRLVKGKRGKDLGYVTRMEFGV